MQPGAHDKGRRGAFSRSGGRYPSRAHGNGALTIRYWVSYVSQPMHALRNHLRRQPIGPSHEQAIQAPCDCNQAPSPIPQGEHVPGDYSPDMLKSTIEAEAISMALASKGAIYLSNMMAELGFGQLFDSAPFFRPQHRRCTHSEITHVSLTLETSRSTVLLQRAG